MFNKILIVCVGNICRSPMGEALLKHYAKQNDLPIEVSSAGIGALVGHPADSKVQEILMEQGINCSEHRARQLTAEILADAELVLVMESGHRREIERNFPSACGKVHLLGKWSNLEIPDPYKKSKEFFQETHRLIKQGINEWQVKLWNSVCCE
jgi:protein-tyrosine phosphatase